MADAKVSDSYLDPRKKLLLSARSTALLLQKGQSEARIADGLNARGIPTDLGRPWTRGTVHQLLINEKFDQPGNWMVRPQRSALRILGKAKRRSSW